MPFGGVPPPPQPPYVSALLAHGEGNGHIWLDRATIQFRFYQPSSFNTALQLVLRPHFLVHFV
jgi:hypothetical protein